MTGCRGFFTFRLCPLTSTSVAAEKAKFSERCLNTYPLKNASTQQTKLWLYSGKPGAHPHAHTAQICVCVCC